MPHLSLLQNHSFTISNLPNGTRHNADDKRKDDPQEMVMYVRAHHGLSRDLLDSVRDQPRRSIRVHVDGPYDGLVDNLPRIFEEIIFVAGGSGIAGCLPWIEHCSRSIDKGSTMIQQFHVLWMVKESSHLSWASKELEEYTRQAGGAMQCRLYVTDKSLSSNADTFRGPQSGALTGDNNKAGDFVGTEQTGEGVTAVAAMATFAAVDNQRPYLPHLLPSLITRRRVAIFGK